MLLMLPVVAAVGVVVMPFYGYYKLRKYLRRKGTTGLERRNQRDQAGVQGGGLMQDVNNLYVSLLYYTSNYWGFLNSYFPPILCFFLDLQ